MSDLKVRKIPFAFDGAPFLWNPQNPGFSLMMNQITFLVIGLEKYFCRAIADAEPLIRDPAVLEEAKLFRIQESVHSQAHRKHCNALIARYPGLKGTLQKCTELYDEIYEQRDLAFHLAYAGGLEAAFTPFFRMILDYRDVLFSGGDARVASLFLWHFCEEIEHRSSAISVFNDVVGRSWYRIRETRHTLAHSKKVTLFLKDEFRKHVADAPDSMFEQSPFEQIPVMAKWRCVAGVLRSQLPGHKPERETVPEYYREWNAHYESGADVTQIYGAPQAVAA